MTNFKDLSPYSYGAADSPKAAARNIGWLSASDDFLTAKADPQFLDRLWRFCKVSIGQTRGFHVCELCHSREANVVRRNSQELLLGLAEIRVASGDGQLYAAPNLIYHYVADHNYFPPPEFVRAVLMGPCPPDDGYFDLLSKFEISWNDTLTPERSSRPFRFVKTPEGVIKVEE